MQKITSFWSSKQENVPIPVFNCEQDCLLKL
jgi:hypothetical protein